MTAPVEYLIRVKPLIEQRRKLAPLLNEYNRLGTPLERRLWLNIEVRGPDECWPWLAPRRKKDGYGKLTVNRRPVLAHRLAYELTVGPIPAGMELDHTCHDPETCSGGVGCPHRACCNPAHLEPVTVRENVLRGAGPCAVNARKTHCKHGHEFTPENTRLDRGYRACRTCANEASA